MVRGKIIADEVREVMGHCNSTLREKGSQEMCITGKEGGREGKRGRKEKKGKEKEKKLVDKLII